ncbi:hypothetical protein FAUST_11043 [Fusarium austroamericanum]|uniref:Translationally-controlled tumor protein homolog n=1 Tax=Fusarium austroamericanum TaxID=282268 RepID=A0AAN5Z157_FUSAU|nr:hypothetical protein FAUST_11043 [Fusarium austroamericanum]
MINLDSIAVEGGDNESDEGTQVNNVIYSFRLQPTNYDKKTYVSSLKFYLRTVKRRLQEIGKDPEYIANFEKSAKDFLSTKILPNFNDLEFFTGESMNVDAMIAIMGYREDGTTPYFMFWKDGFEEMRV